MAVVAKELINRGNGVSEVLNTTDAYTYTMEIDALVGQLKPLVQADEKIKSGLLILKYQRKQNVSLYGVTGIINRGSPILVETGKGQSWFQNAVRVARRAYPEFDTTNPGDPPTQLRRMSLSIERFVKEYDISTGAKKWQYKDVKPLISAYRAIRTALMEGGFLLEG